MSIGLNNLPNITVPDSDYPNGSIRDKAIAIPGTAVNKLTYDDLYQTFMKWLRLSEITPNVLPDNEYNGFQYIQALFNLFGDYSRRIYKDGFATSNIIEADYNELAICKPDCGASHVVSITPPSSTYKGRCRIANNSDNTIDLYDQPGTNNINGAAPPYVLGTHEYIELSYDSGGTNWVIEKRFKLEPVPF